MIIRNNKLAANAYAPYQKNINMLARSAARLSTGERFASAEDGTGDLGVVDRMRNEVRGVNTMITGLQSANSMSNTQDDILNNVSDIITRMTELAAASVDPTKQDADRDALEVEFRVLASEVADVAADAKYNGTRLFETTRTVRVGMESTDIITLSAIQLSLLTFVNESVSTVTAASATLLVLSSRVLSLATLRAHARGHAGRVERTMDYLRSYSANLGNAESAIRDIDIAQETGNFTKQQVVNSAAQAVLAQLNGQTQSALQFLQF